MSQVFGFLRHIQLMDGQMAVSMVDSVPFLVK
jgi:hypothetical protein